MYNIIKNSKNKITKLVLLICLTLLLNDIEFEPLSVPARFLSNSSLLSTIKQLSDFSSHTIKVDHTKAELGQRLFFDPGFSINGKISCASCHIPERQFSEDKPVAETLAKGTRRTPSLVNQAFNNWFFWDGRSDSLASQALGPIENPIEHGISRLFVVKRIIKHYSSSFQEFGIPLNEKLLEIDIEHALPKPKATPYTPTLAAYTMASIKSFGLLNQIISQSQAKDITPAQEVFSRYRAQANHDPKWYANWEALKTKQQQEIQTIFAAFGQMIAEYVKTIQGIESPFDHFAQRALKTQTLEEALSPEFDAEALVGLKIFTGPGKCTLCHNGPNFTDQRFHNIGLPGVESAMRTHLDVGRTEGLPQVRVDPFNCQGKYNSNSKSVSCQELLFLDDDSLELVGAFKTPSLRNVALRPPYFHDGRFQSLEDVVQHYLQAEKNPGLGHMEESIVPLFLSSKQTKALLKFLETLNSPITFWTPNS